MKTAIIIVTYNRLELLKECIECALKQKNEETELVIVNNNCTDGTYEYLTSLSNERIHCLHENDNIGGAGGFHDGLKYAVENTKCDWFLLIDDDAMISSDYLHKIYSKIVPSVKAYAGTVLVDGEIDTSHRLLKGVDHNITVNIIKNSAIVDKKALHLPHEIRNVIHCKNPRCITSIEQGLDHIFVLTDPEKEIYRCKYCEEKYDGRRK